MSGRADYVCPRCHGTLHDEGGALSCEDHGRFPIRGGIPDFVADDDLTGSSAFYETVFDRAADIYESPLWYPLGIRLGSGASLDWLLSWVTERIPADSTVLDAPTGTGLFAREIAGDAATVHGIDIAEGMLHRARRSARRRGLGDYGLARARVERLPFPADRFDVGVCTGALYLLDDPVAALEEIRRAVASEGRLLGMTVVEGGPLASTVIRRGYEAATGIDVSTTEELAGWLDAAGFGAPTTERRGAILLFAAPVR